MERSSETPMTAATAAKRAGSRAMSHATLHRDFMFARLFDEVTLRSAI
jgi:hypothetical protein